MIDIHCHILPGIDDGAVDLTESLAMARIAYQDGIRHIVATPHFNTIFHVPKPVVVNKVRMLQKELDKAGIALTLSPGNEVTLSDEAAFYKQFESGEFCYLNEAGTFVLLEQPWAGYLSESEQIIDNLVRNGITPIIPHPERHLFFREQPGLLIKLLERGAWTQVSADSLVGRFQEEVRQFACWLVENDYVHTLATDAHNIDRKPNLAAGYNILTELAGEARKREVMERMRQIIPDEDRPSSKNPVTA